MEGERGRTWGLLRGRLILRQVDKQTEGWGGVQEVGLPVEDASF